VILRATVLAASAGWASSAVAQTPSFTQDTVVSLPLFWSEVNGNGNRVLEPGESAAVVLNIAFSNQFGAVAFAPPIGTFSSGTILGFGSGFIDIEGAGGTQGTCQNGSNPGPTTNNGTTGYGVRLGWRRAGDGNGFIDAAAGRIREIIFLQAPPEPAGANTTNPIDRMYAFLWTPASYAPRGISFSIAPVSGSTLASVYLDLDHSVGASVYIVPANWDLTPVEIPIVPAPAGAGLLALGLIMGRPRRARSRA
jgi:hypothetical protein